MTWLTCREQTLKLISGAAGLGWVADTTVLTGLDNSTVGRVRPR